MKQAYCGECHESHHSSMRAVSVEGLNPRHSEHGEAKLVEGALDTGAVHESKKSYLRLRFEQGLLKLYRLPW